jgi:hypothetical protein
MRVIAACTNDDLGLEEEVEVNGASVKTMEVLIDLGMAKVYDDTKPMVGKSVNIYEAKRYPRGRQVFYNDSIYISKVSTSNTFVPAEWEKLVTGRDSR